MTLEEMQACKEYARQLGYVIKDDFDNKNMFTASYPNAYDKYQAVLDFSYKSLASIDFSRDRTKKLMELPLIINKANYEKIYLNDTNISFVKRFLRRRWKYYKQYLLRKKIGQINKDF